MSKPKIAVWGASGHAMVVADILRLRGEYEIAAFLDDLHPERQGTMFLGAPILGGREQLSRLKDEAIEHMIIAVGNCEQRLRLAAIVRDRGFSLVSAVHRQAIVAADAIIGPGTVVAAGAVINPGAHVGSNVIVNTLAGIDHECQVHDGAHIGPGARLGGNVTVGRGTQVSIGATVINQVSIGAGSLIGAGAVVVRDIPDGVVAFGVPARVVREYRPQRAAAADATYAVSASRVEFGRRHAWIVVTPESPPAGMPAGIAETLDPGTLADR